MKNLDPQSEMSAYAHASEKEDKENAVHILKIKEKPM